MMKALKRITTDNYYYYTHDVQNKFLIIIALCVCLYALIALIIFHVPFISSSAECTQNYDQVYTPTFLWKFGIAMLSDKHESMNYVLPTVTANEIRDIDSFQNIRHGDIIWIRDLQLFDFVNIILPNIHHYFTLIIATNIDWITPLYFDNLQYNKPPDVHQFTQKIHQKYGDLKDVDIFAKLIKNEFILFLYAENYDGSLDAEYDNIEGIPIGMDFHTAFTNPTDASSIFGHTDITSLQEYKIKKLLNDEKFPKFENRRFQIYLDSSLNIIYKYGQDKYDEYLQHWNETTFTNTDLLEKLYLNGTIHRKLWYRSWLLHNIQNNKLFYVDDSKYNQYGGFLKRSQFMFAFSPFGNGMDCHRTYESLLFGNIVIIQSSPLDKMFRKHDLPVVIINNLNEINQTMLKYWYHKYKDKVSINNANTRYKLTNQYWISYIRQNTLNKLQFKLNPK